METVTDCFSAALTAASVAAKIAKLLTITDASTRAALPFHRIDSMCIPLCFDFSLSS
jgi:hypothetical protein